jgi:peptidoglycan hydrolase-like protein with peptidoglycan-binding domain
MSTLQEGSVGAVVRSFQQRIWPVEHGPGAIDGELGPYTKASVQAFQIWGGVIADGIVGDQTWAVW